MAVRYRCTTQLNDSNHSEFSGKPEKNSQGETISCHRHKKDMFNEAKEPKLYLKRRIFLGKGPSQGQISGLLGHGSKIPVAIL
jgi:hypothetical protein